MRAAKSKKEPEPIPVRFWDAREFCIQKHEDGVWGNTLPAILILGKRYSGKTCACIDLCFQLQDQFDYAVVFSGSEDGEPTFGNMFPDIFIYSEVTPERINRIFERQTKIMNEHRNDPNINPQLLVIFDDCVDRTISQLTEFQKVFKKFSEHERTHERCAFQHLVAHI